MLFITNKWLLISKETSGKTKFSKSITSEKLLGSNRAVRRKKFQKRSSTFCFVSCIIFSKKCYAFKDEDFD